MRAFKFVNRRFLDDMVNLGRMRIGTAASYRIDDGFAAGRSDPNEMVRDYKPNREVTVGEMPWLHNIFKLPPDADQRLRIRFADADSGLRIATDAYMFCASRNVTRLMRRLMAERFDADSCVAISDIEEFARRVTRTVPRLCTVEPSHGAWAPVTYGRVDVRSLTDPVDSYFKKDPSFRWQQEVRILWQGQVPREPFTVDVPRIVPLLSVYNR